MKKSEHIPRNPNSRIKQWCVVEYHYLEFRGEVSDEKQYFPTDEDGRGINTLPVSKALATFKISSEIDLHNTAYTVKLC